MTKALWFCAAALAAPIAPAQASGLAGATVCQVSHRAPAYPTLCSIPQIPTDVRDARAFKAAVVDTRQAGRRLVEKTSGEGFSLPLNGAATFSADARVVATPPSSAAGPAPQDTASFEADARRRVQPPRRPHP